MKSRKRLLSQNEFDRAAALIEMESKNIELARQVLVAGKRQIVVAAEANVTRSWVSAIVIKFSAKLEEIERTTVPEDWETDTVSLPKDLWATVRHLEREARSNLKKGA